MKGVRRQVSLLLAEGHVDAQFYPLGMVFVETEIAVDRINAAFVTQATLTQLAVGSLLSKEQAKEFKNTTKKLLEG